MASPTLDLSPHFVYFVAGVAVATLVAARVTRGSELDAIPTVGPNSWFGSWRAGFKFSENGLDLLREGYAKHKDRPFKLADRYHWLVIVSSRDHLEELRKTTKDQFSFEEAVRTRLSTDYTMGKEVHLNPYHIPFVRSHLSRRIGSSYFEVQTAIATTLAEVLNLGCDEWKNVAALNVIQKVVFRTSNRFFVGPPLCDDPNWMDFNLQNAFDVVTGGTFLQRFPPFLQSFASLFITNISQNTKRGMKFLAPIIAERQRSLDEYGDKWVNKPNDFLSWLMDVAEGEERTTECLTRRVMLLNFASVHSTAQSFTHALLYLAANLKYMQPLREEVDAAIEQEGWSKEALAKMFKVDSFLRENQRLKGSGSESLARRAMKDFMFSDGTFIPRGTLISAPAGCIHLDNDFYEHPTTFDPFRFAKLREAEGEGEKHQFVSTSLEYLPFGHGRDACPGRFFAVTQMKIMLAYIILSYDLKLADNEVIPEDIFIGTTMSVDPNARVMFRRRE